MKKREFYSLLKISNTGLENFTSFLLFFIILLLIRLDHSGLNITSFYKKLSFFALGFYTFIFTSKYINSIEKTLVFPFLFLNIFLFLTFNNFIKNGNHLFFYLLIIYLNLIFLLLIKFINRISFSKTMLIIFHIDLISIFLYYLQKIIIELADKNFYNYICIILFFLSFLTLIKKQKKEYTRLFFYLISGIILLSLLTIKTISIPANLLMIVILLIIRSFFTKQLKDCFHSGFNLKFQNHSVLGIFFLTYLSIYNIFGNYIFFNLFILMLSIDYIVKLLFKFDLKKYIFVSNFFFLILYFYLFFNPEGII